MLSSTAGFQGLVLIHYITVKQLAVSIITCPFMELKLTCEFRLVLIEGEARIFKRHQGLRLIDIPNCAKLVFVYQRPPIWQTLTLGRDLFYKTRYDDELEISHPSRTHSDDEDIGVLRFFGTTSISLPMLLEAFEEGEKEKSRFGFNAQSIRAMQGAALVYRLQRRYSHAERVLEEALACTQRVLGADHQIQPQIQYELGEVYLEQGKLDHAARKFLLVEIAILGHTGLNATYFRVNLFGSLATIALRRRQLQQAESLLVRALSSTFSICGVTDSLRFTLYDQMSIVHCAQGRFSEAQAVCGMALLEQKAKFGLGLNHHHTLRTALCLAKVLCEQHLSYEAMTLYRQLLPRLYEILGPNHEYTLTTIETMAQILYREGLLAESETLCRELCDGYECGLGEDNPTTWEAKFLLAQILKDRNMDRKAIEVLERLFQRMDTFYGLNHPESRRVLYVLEYLYRRRGDASIAEHLRRKLRNRHADHSGKSSLAISSYFKFANRPSISRHIWL